MHSLGLMIVLALSRDAGVNPDSAIPAWAPRLRPAVDVEGSYGLHPWGRGYFYEDGKFEAQVAPDGTVKFKDKRGSAAFMRPWAANTPRPQAPLPERTARDPATARRAPWLPPPEPAQNAPRRQEPVEVCPPSSSCYAGPPNQTPLNVSGGFDLTDEIMRSLGKDPHARDKARFLSATFEFRMKLAIEARKQDMMQALETFPRRLEDLWADTRYSPRERRRILYELWIQMDNTADGARAAKMIELFIRRRLPCGAVDGYTPAELGAFRASHPQQPFTPGDTCKKASP
jgi:hypothetical protein